MYEVELKFPLASPEPVLAALGELGAVRHEPVRQRDVYFGHPSRDFGETDEALRVRVAGDRNVVTYKGPVVDALTKTRREIEIGFDDGRAGEFEEMLRLLSFREVRAVEKTRTPYGFTWEELPIEASIDEVVGLGTFFEIEATAADDAAVPTVRDAILRLAERLGLESPERRSYLVMLLERG